MGGALTRAQPIPRCGPALAVTSHGSAGYSWTMRLSVLVVAASVAACSSGGPTAPLDREFKVAIGETVSIAGTGLTVKFVRVTQDNRCPLGVLCIVAGNGQIEFEARLNGEPTTLLLNTTLGPQNGNVGPYDVALAELLPLRTVDDTISDKDYRAGLVITR